MFKVGQKVVCIADEWEVVVGEPDSAAPKRGETLVIAGERGSIDYGQLIRFDKYDQEDCLNWFDAASFRPLQEAWAEEVLEKAEKQSKEEIVLA